MRHDPSSGELVTVSAADPLNMAGILVPGERVAANSGRQVTFSDGVGVPEDQAPGTLKFVRTEGMINPDFMNRTGPALAESGG